MGIKIEGTGFRIINFEGTKVAKIIRERTMFAKEKEHPAKGLVV